MEPSTSHPVPSADQERLLQALYREDVELMETLLENPEVKVDYWYPKKGTLLEIACRTPSPRSDKVVQFLLEKVKPNVYEIKPEPIHYAAERGNHKALRELLRKKGTRVNAQKSDGRTALHLAAKNFNTNPENYGVCLELLLQCPSVDINRPNTHNCTAIREAAVFSGKDAVVRMLELRPVGFDLDSHQHSGRTARQVILAKFPDLERLLPPIKVATSETSDPQALLLQGLLNRHLDVFKGLLQQVDQDGMPVLDPDYFYRQPFSTTCLYKACSDVRLYDYLDALLKAKANPNLVNVATRMAPIHVAISAGNLSAAKLLLKHVALNVNVGDKKGDTPLHYVARFVNDDGTAVQLVRELLEKGADVTVRNDEGHSAVMAAALLRKVELVREMLPETDIEEEVSSGVSLKTFLETHLPAMGDLVNVDSRNTDLNERLKRKLFLTLYAENCDSFVRELRKCKMADKDLRKLLDDNDKKNTFLQTACALPGSNRVVEELLERGADPNLTVKDEIMSPPVVEELLKRGADPNLTVKDNNMSPPLVVAAERKNYDVMRIMLDKAKDRIDVNRRDRKGQTALHVVSKNRDLKMVVRLLNAGARMDIRNNLGKEPISTAAMKDLMDMSLQADENKYPYDVDYRIKLFFGLFVQRRPSQPQQQAPAPGQPAAATRNQRDVGRNSLNRSPQVGNSVTRATGDEEQSEEHPLVVQRQESLPPQPQQQAPAPGQPAATTRNQRDVERNPPQVGENMYPYDVDYRIKRFFGLLVQRRPPQPQQQAPAPGQPAAATRNQRDVGRNSLNRSPQVGSSVTRATGNEEQSEEHHLIRQRQESLPPQPQKQAPAPGQPAATTRNQRDVERNRNDEYEEQSEAARLCYITENYSEDRILKHPLVQSFIFLKWPKLKAFYIANLVCVILFTLFLNVFILMGCNETGSCADAVSKTLAVLTTIFWAGIVVRELLQISTAFGKYISNKENILDVALIASTVCSVYIPWSIEDVRLGFSVVTVLLSWSELFVVSGRMPLLSEYMEILKTVTKNFLFFLMWYSTLLVSFTLCFYLLLRTNKSFSNVGLAFFNVITMMIGEVNTENIRFDAAPFLSYPLFVVFIFLVAIVLLNLLNGLAISGIQEIREAASLLSIRSRVRLIKDIEYSLMNICKRRIPLVSKVLSVDKIMVFSVRGAAEGDYGYIYPNSNSSPHILIGALGRKHSLDQSVLSETMKIIGEKSVATADSGKVTAQTAIQKMQDLLQEMQANASRNISDS